MNKVKILKILFSLIGVLCLTTLARAQDENPKPMGSPPIPVEIFFGNNRFVSQIAINKRFTASSRFGILATSFIAADYANDKSENESMNVALINC